MGALARVQVVASTAASLTGEQAGYQKPPPVSLPKLSRHLPVVN